MSQKVTSRNGTTPASGTQTASVTELREDIAQHRQELAQTVDALAAKLDVKARTRARLEAGRAKAVETVTTARDHATDDNGAVRPELLVAAGVLALSVTAITLLGLRRRSS